MLTSAALLCFLWHPLSMLQAYQSRFLCPNVLPLYCLKTFPQALSLPGRLSLPGVAELIDSQLAGQGVSYSSPYAPIRLCTSLSSHCIRNYGNCPNKLPGWQLRDGREHACHLTVNPARCGACCSSRVLSDSPCMSQKFK